MKSLVLIGGLLGFALGFAFSWMKENAWPSILLHASLSAYVTGLLLRWWGRAWLRGLESAMTERTTQLTSVKLTPAAKTNKT